MFPERRQLKLYSPYVSGIAQISDSHHDSCSSGMFQSHFSRAASISRIHHNRARHTSGLFPNTERPAVIHPSFSAIISTEIWHGDVFKSVLVCFFFYMGLIKMHTFLFVIFYSLSSLTFINNNIRDGIILLKCFNQFFIDL